MFWGWNCSLFSSSCPWGYHVGVPWFLTCFNLFFSPVLLREMYFPFFFYVEISGKLRAVLHGIVYSNLDGFWCLRMDLKQAEPGGNSPILSGSRYSRVATFTASFKICQCSIRTIILFVSKKQHSSAANPCMTRVPLPKLLPGEGSLHNGMQQAGHCWGWTPQCSLVSTGLRLAGVFLQTYFVHKPYIHAHKLLDSNLSSSLTGHACVSTEFLLCQAEQDWKWLRQYSIFQASF